MSVYDSPFLNSELSKRTSIFGLRLWVVIGILLGSLIVLALFLLSLCLSSHRKRRNSRQEEQRRQKEIATTPLISKEIQEIVNHPAPVPEIQVDIGKIEHRVVFSDRPSSGESKGTVRASETASFHSGSVGPEVSHLGWGRWYTLRELEAATNGFVEETVIGEGGYGIVYCGVLSDGTKVAVKNLLNNSHRNLLQKDLLVGEKENDSRLAGPTVGQNCCHSSSEESSLQTRQIDDTMDRVDHGKPMRVVPDFSQVYSFLGSVFDPNASGHIQRLKQMDPINFETALLLMRNLAINLTSPEFEDHRKLLSRYGVESERGKFDRAYSNLHAGNSQRPIPSA